VKNLTNNVCLLREDAGSDYNVILYVDGRKSKVKFISGYLEHFVRVSPNCECLVTS
jgi:hypothetical protein